MVAKWAGYCLFREGRGADQGPTLWTVDVTGYNERPISTPGWASDRRGHH